MPIGEACHRKIAPRHQDTLLSSPSVISILIVSFNTAPELVACLESLARCAAALPHEIIVVDNDSSDGSVEARSEEHTSELQSPCNLVCRLLLEKKKKT